MKTQQAKRISLVVIAIALLVSAALYLTLIYTNCDTTSAGDLITDFGAFHSEPGC